MSNRNNFKVVFSWDNESCKDKEFNLNKSIRGIKYGQKRPSRAVVSLTEDTDIMDRDDANYLLERICGTVINSLGDNGKLVIEDNAKLVLGLTNEQ